MSGLVSTLFLAVDVSRTGMGWYFHFYGVSCLVMLRPVEVESVARSPSFREIKELVTFSLWWMMNLIIMNLWTERGLDL